jgi:nucleoside phosphorylase
MESKYDRLAKLKEELEQIDPQVWSYIKTWAAKAKVTIRLDWPEFLDDFQDLVKEPRWWQSPRVGGPLPGFSINQSGPDPAVTDRNINRGKALDAKRAIINFLDGLLSSAPSSGHYSSVPLTDSISSDATSQLQGEANTNDQLTIQQPSPQQFDVLLITVNDHEYDAVSSLARARLGTELPTIHRKRTYYDLGYIGGARVALVRSEMGSGQPGGSAFTTLQAMSDLQPKYIIAVGIMFGVDPNKQKIGHVMYSRQLQNYDLKKIGTDERTGEPKITPRGDRVSANPRFLSRVRDAADHWPEGRDEGKPEDALLLSGDNLIDNFDYREMLLRQFDEAKGGEMEASGIYSAAREEEAQWMVIKAICDYADGNKKKNKKKRQQLAATRAARFVFYLLDRGGLAEQ